MTNESIKVSYISKINVFDFAIWFALAVIFPFSNGLITLSNCLNVLIYLGATYFVADIILSKIMIIVEIPSFIKMGFYIIFGSIICGLFYLFLASNFVLYALFLFFIVIGVTKKRFVYEISSIYIMLCISPLIVMLFQTNELVYATTTRICKADGDFFLYNTIVESLKINHNFNDAIYHQGIGINYQALSLIAPAQLAKFSGISSTISLWGVYSKIVPIVAFSLLGYSIIVMFESLFNTRLNKKKFHLQLFFVSCLLLFFGPLHLLNVIKRDFANTLFLGEGYLLPLGSPGFAMSILLTGFILLLIINIEKPGWLEKAIFIFTLTFIVGCKVAMFFPLAIFLGVYSLLLASKKNYQWLLTMIIAFPLCIFVYKLTSSSVDNIAHINFTTSGFYKGYLLELATKYHLIGTDVKKLTVIFSVTLLMWLSVKLLLLLSGIYLFRKINKKVLCLVIATLISFIFSLLPSFFLNVFGQDENGKYLFDLSFDMPQFIRAGIFLITIVSIILIQYFVYLHKNYIVKKLFIYGTFIWMLIISYSFIKTNYKPPRTADVSWYNDAKTDFLKVKPKLLAMSGNNQYSGQALVANGVHPWYCTGTRNEGDGYTFTKGVHRRNIEFAKIFDTSNTMLQKQNIMLQLKKNGVDYIIATPSNINKFNTILRDSLIIKVEGTKWMFKLN